mmetsp:Transcript_130018/g.362258  ORF Transcript_130018/g.362258 Transcript_130018/m.362258 type:complete len:223 (-) Transcript_130018:392-1060(-)
MHQPVDLLQVIRELEHVKDLDQGRNYACVLQHHRVDKLQTDRVGQGESLTEEGSNLLDVNLAPPQEGRHVDRVVSRDAGGDEEGEAEAGLAVEDQHADALELLFVLLGPDDRLPGHKEGLVLQAATDDVLARACVLAKVPRCPRRLLHVELVRPDGLVRSVVRAKLSWHLALRVPRVVGGASLQQTNNDFPSAHQHRNVQWGPAGCVRGLQEVIVLHHILHD